MAQTAEEFKSIYKKMDKLTSLCYPKYVKTYGTQMQSPLTKLRYGELFGTTNKELLGYVKSISYAIDQSSTYETDPKLGRAPRHINATIGYQVIHDETPNINTRFYGMSELRAKETEVEAREIADRVSLSGNIPSDIPL